MNKNETFIMIISCLIAFGIICGVAIIADNQSKMEKAVENLEELNIEQNWMLIELAKGNRYTSLGSTLVNFKPVYSRRLDK